MSIDRRSYAAAARDLLRDSLLDAATGLIVAKSWNALTMADIARGAGVSRQTLYNEFGTRNEFAQALVMREVQRLLATAENAVRAHFDDPATALRDAFDAFLDAARTPLITAVVASDEADELMRLVTTHGAPVVQYASARLAQLLIEGWPDAAQDDARLLAEALVRLALGSIAIPGGPELVDGSSVQRLLAPFVEQTLARGGPASPGGAPAAPPLPPHGANR